MYSATPRDNVPVDGAQDGRSTRAKDLEQFPGTRNVDDLLQSDVSFRDSEVPVGGDTVELFVRRGGVFSEECEYGVALGVCQLGQRKRQVSWTYRHTGKDRPVQPRRRDLDLPISLIQHHKHVHLPRLADPAIETPQVLLVPLCQRLLLRRKTRRIVTRELELADTAGPGSRGGRGGEQADRGELGSVGDAVGPGGEVGGGARGRCFGEFRRGAVGVGDGGVVCEGQGRGRSGSFGREEGTVRPEARKRKRKQMMSTQFFDDTTLTYPTGDKMT